VFSVMSPVPLVQELLHQIAYVVPTDISGQEDQFHLLVLLVHALIFVAPLA